MKPPTDAQLRWMRAIREFWLRDHYYPGCGDLLELLGMAPSSTNAAVEMLERLERDGLVEWPLLTIRRRTDSRFKGQRDLCRRANSIRLTEAGIFVLKQNS